MVAQVTGGQKRSKMPYLLSISRRYEWILTSAQIYHWEMHKDYYGDIGWLLVVLCFTDF